MDISNPHTFEVTKALVSNQALLNSTAYSTEWLDKGKSREFHYLIAASQEIAEFINSYWLPWWSKAERDMANCRIELVDALHFLISELIIQYGEDGAAQNMANSYDAAKYIMDAMKPAFADGLCVTTLLMESKRSDATLEFARHTLVSINVAGQIEDDEDSVFDITTFFMLCLSIDFDIDKLSALYLGKSTLNKFRQDKGYKQGTYKKKWDGVHEDNYFLSVWIDEQVTAPTTEQIRNWLEEQYRAYDQTN